MKMEQTECSETLALNYRPRGITKKKAYDKLNLNLKALDVEKSWGKACNIRMYVMERQCGY
jgi:hypothetical protein